jgi:prepilin-type N-terminal cleavage/methylation domain-containing protein
MKSAHGYSLVELAIVVLIVSILLSMGLAAFNAAAINSALSATAKKELVIKDALAGYLLRNNRLPCPDTDFAAPDGIENRTTANDPTTACSNRFGIVPFSTLGLARADVLDSWENFFSYAVSNTAPRNDWTTTANFAAGNGGDFTVNDRQTINPYATVAISTNSVAVIISHGINGNGAYTTKGTRLLVPAAGTDEETNTLGGTTYFRRPFSNVALGAFGDFDDVVLNLTADEVLALATKDGAMLNYQAQTQKAFADARNEIIGYALTNCTLPLAITAYKDGWGSVLNYAPVDPDGTKIPAMPITVGTNAYTLSSNGPDKLTGGANSADDILRNMDPTTLKGILGQAGINLTVAPCTP